LSIPPDPPEPPRRSIPRSWMFGGAILLTLAAFAFWGYPRFAVPVRSAPATPTVTFTFTPSSPTSSPTATATALPTETVTPTPVVDLGIGGANKIALTANDDIYVMDMNGSHLRQLTNTNIPKFDLQWLPGGSEILYGEANCVYKIHADTPDAEPEQLACFREPKFDGFRVSPDGRHVAISIERRLLVLPFDLEAISSVSSAFELQALDEMCLDYTDVAVKGAQWSTDGQSLAIVYQSVVNQRLGDTIRVLRVDMDRCQEVDPLIMDEFPAKRFLPDGYERFPILPSYTWDGDQRFLLNSFQRNVGYGELYVYDMSTAAMRKINPIDGACCYGAAAFSPDGSHILLVFQDVRRGAESENQLYYIPMEQLGTPAEFTPIKLPLRFFPDLREDIQLALRPALP
jgi:Tol biopolymer transport system component